MDTVSSDTWATMVSARAVLPDQRLNGRFALVLAALAAKPSDGIAQACGPGGPTKAAYRFIENRRVMPRDLLNPVIQTTADACLGLPVVYAIQDTTSLNYSHRSKTTGLGPITDSAARGLHVHTTLAVTTDGMVLGLLGQDAWARPEGAIIRCGQDRRVEVAGQIMYARAAIWAARATACPACARSGWAGVTCNCWSPVTERPCWGAAISDLGACRLRYVPSELCGWIVD